MLPRALYKVDAVREIERRAVDDSHIPSWELMERAGGAAFALLREQWPHATRLAVVCGPGNNGGDGYVVARLAHGCGLQVDVVQVGQATISGDAGRALGQMQTAGLVLGASLAPLREAEVIVDALFGIGLNKLPQGAACAAIEAINSSPAARLSLDIPSGLAANTGEVLGIAVAATATITFIGVKPGLLTGAAADHIGALHFAGLEVPAQAYSSVTPTAHSVDWATLKALLPRRRRTAHKGDNGHVLIIGGAPGMSGAVRLTAAAALRVGAGLVSVATHPSTTAEVSAARPEIMVHGVRDAADLIGLLARATVIAIGPGLGQSPWALDLFACVREGRQPVIFDADALSLLAIDPDSNAARIITPHPGEAARLLGGITTRAIAHDRFAAARDLHTRYGGAVVLKGAGTIVESCGVTQVIRGGNPGMATGGMGDALTGVIAGLLAQGMALNEAAVAGAALHAAAADCAAVAGERGLLASDLMPHLRALVN